MSFRVKRSEIEKSLPRTQRNRTARGILVFLREPSFLSIPACPYAKPPTCLCRSGALAGETRLEHATDGFGDRCSTIELLPYGRVSLYNKLLVPSRYFRRQNKTFLFGFGLDKPSSPLRFKIKPAFFPENDAGETHRKKCAHPRGNILHRLDFIDREGPSVLPDEGERFYSPLPRKFCRDFHAYLPKPHHALVSAVTRKIMY